MNARALWGAVIASLALYHLGAWIIPVGAMLRDSLAGERATALRDAWPVAKATLLQAGASTLLSLLFGALLTWILRGGARSGRASVLTFLAFPFGLPTVVAGLAALAWIGAQGWATGVLWPAAWVYSMASVIGVHVALNAPWVALRLLPALDEIPARWTEAAAVLGATRAMRFRKILLPALLPTVLHSAVQVFCLSATSFALVLMLGGGPPVETLETLIYSRVRLGEPDPQGALAASLLQFALLLAPALALAGLELRALARGMTVEAESELGRFGNANRSLGALAAAIGVLPWLTGLAIPMVFGLSLENARQVFAEFAAHFSDSLKVSLPSSLLTVSLAFATVLLSQARRLPLPVRTGALLLGVLPSGISVLLLSLGFWRFWAAHVDPFGGSVAALVAIQSVIFFPLVIRILAPVAVRTPWRQLEAAATLGAEPLQAWTRIEWPRWRVPMVTALLLVFSASLGEVAALSFFAGEGFSPVTLWLRELASHYQFAEARFASLVFVVILLVIGWSVTRLSARSLSS